MATNTNTEISSHVEGVKNIVRKLSSRPEYWIETWLDQHCPVLQKTPRQYISEGKGQDLIDKLTNLHLSETNARNRPKKN